MTENCSSELSGHATAWESASTPQRSGHGTRAALRYWTLTTARCQAPLQQMRSCGVSCVTARQGQFMAHPGRSADRAYRPIVWQAHRRTILIERFTVIMHVPEGTDRILGASIVTPRVNAMIIEMALILRARVAMKAMAEPVHTYQTQSGGIRLAAPAYERQFASVSYGTDHVNTR